MTRVKTTEHENIVHEKCYNADNHRHVSEPIRSSACNNFSHQHRHEKSEPSRAGQRCGRTHLVLPRRTSRRSGRSRPSTSSSSGDMILPLSGTHTGALLCGSAHTHTYTRTSPEAFKIKHTNFSLSLSIIWMPHVTHRIQSYKNKDKNEAATTQISFTECVFFVDVGLEWRLAVSWDSCSPRL